LLLLLAVRVPTKEGAELKEATPLIRTAKSKVKNFIVVNLCAISIQKIFSGQERGQAAS
jgi:hypothetical protein